MNALQWTLRSNRRKYGDDIPADWCGARTALRTCTRPCGHRGFHNEDGQWWWHANDLQALAAAIYFILRAWVYRDCIEVCNGPSGILGHCGGCPNLGREEEIASMLKQVEEAQREIVNDR